METETIYRCSVCGCSHPTAEEATDCENQKPQVHKYAVGDVLKISHYPADYCETEYLIVEKLVWKDARFHKQNPVYKCEGWHDPFLPTEVKELYMTSDERKQLLEIAKYKAESLDVSLYDIEWDRKNGEYTFSLSFGKNKLKIKGKE